jgi:hypothetical protein
MKIRTNIDNVAGRYEVQVETYGFTALEEEKMRDFGEPLVATGGSFSGSVSRSGQGNTVVTISGDGEDAEAVPVIVNGVVTGINVSDGGSGYTSATVIVSGDGSGAVATATIDDGVITEIVVSNGGSGYNVVPIVVSFDLPTATRRLRSDFPVKQVFDLEDDLDSDAKAKVWGDTIASRCAAAKATLVSRSSPFEGETVTTV